LLAFAVIHSTDLGYLLHKNPARSQEIGLNFGKAYVFYPEATDHRCTASLLLDIDPVGLTHLYVLIPVLDNDKHYYVGEAELENL
jgi:hypothetical protein